MKKNLYQGKAKLVLLFDQRLKNSTNFARKTLERIESLPSQVI